MENIFILFYSIALYFMYLCIYTTPFPKRLRGKKWSYLTRGQCSQRPRVDTRAALSGAGSCSNARLRGSSEQVPEPGSVRPGRDDPGGDPRGDGSWGSPTGLRDCSFFQPFRPQRTSPGAAVCPCSTVCEGLSPFCS